MRYPNTTAEIPGLFPPEAIPPIRLSVAEYETPAQAARRLEATWSLEQAKVEARRKGVSPSGTKRDIIQRLA